MRRRHVLMELCLALLSGAMTALCLPRAGLCALGWISLAPLIGMCLQAKPRTSLVLGFCAGFAFHGLALYWIYSTCRFAGLPRAVGLLAW